MIANLNSVVPDGLVCPNGRRSIEYVDTGRTVLYIAVKASRPGYGVFRLRYRDKNGVTRHISLGNTETITLITAREKAKKLKAEITLGSDPRAEENAKKAVPTFSEFFEEQYIPLVKPRKRTWKKDLEYYELRLKAEFGNKRLNQITRHQIQTLHTRLKGEGLAASTCNHYLKLTHRVFQICLDFSLVEKKSRGPHTSL